jgi:hypothetical protein
MSPPLDWHEDHWRVREPDGRWEWLGRCLVWIVVGLAFVGLHALYTVLID